MLRLTLIEIILFLTPFALYGAWRLLQRTVPDNPRPMPSVLLGVVGGLLAAIGLVALVLVGERGGPQDGRYVPARFENGRVQHSGFTDEIQERQSLPDRPFGAAATRTDEDPGAFDSPDADPQPEPDLPDDAEIGAPPENPAENPAGTPTDDPQ
ncbi:MULTISPECIES: DUF6111 family protein [Hyphobacterium]|uniref:DUF6111 family protein n=1 Tax=Hyphobacterium vulgare TaxID=1736751 RepID=A0ABV6ZZJ4_9PROT